MTAIFYITENGLHLAKRLKGLYPDAQIIKFKAEAIPEFWNKCKNLIFILATGIVVRTIATLIKDKKTDPAVVVLDEKGRFAISLLSGHLGGANAVAKEIADYLSGKAVITTASDVNKLTEPLYLRPRNLIIGIGCNSGTPEDEIENVIKNTLRENNLSFSSIHSIATINEKGNEGGLIAFAQKYGFEIKTFSSEELNRVEGITKSESVFKVTGAYAVAEPSALLASGADKLLIPKQKTGNVTVAVAVKNSSNQNPRLYIVGIGPGNIEHITPSAKKAIRESDVIVGYDTYLNLIHELIKDKDIISTGMTEEIERCKKAIELAMTGKTVSVISGGDPGIYAMAGLVFEILKSHQSSVISHQSKDEKESSDKDRGLPTVDCRLSIEVIPGIPAFSACAARLGAPLMHDFVCISLSDRLTPWDLIEQRLEAVAKANLVIVLYNPKSRGRHWQIERARDLLIKHKDSRTPVGIVRGAMREDEGVIITDLENMLNHAIDMQSTVIIGNSETFIWKNWMITPRGYKIGGS